MASAPAGGPMQRAVDAQHAGVGKIEIEIGAHWLRAKVHFPLIAGIQRDGEIGIQERERFLLVALLEIDARVFRLDIGKARSTAGITLAGGGVWDVRCLDQDRSKVPTPIGARGPDSNWRRRNGCGRLQAGPATTTKAAGTPRRCRSEGWARSRTEDFLLQKNRRTRKPGRGSKRSLTEEICTCRPMLRLMLSAILC